MEKKRGANLHLTAAQDNKKKGGEEKRDKVFRRLRKLLSLGWSERGESSKKKIDKGSDMS